MSNIRLNQVKFIFCSFQENHSIDEINRAKDLVQILTEINGQSFFDRIESIILNRLGQIRDQVLQRFQCCPKKSNEIQSFLSYFLDEYYSFINNSMNLSSIVSYLENCYLQPLNVTWTMYNKHLFEKFVYMDKKVHHSMSTMIDLLQPMNDDCDDCSPARCVQLLNRFLAFDEEMSEIDYLQKSFQERTDLPANKFLSRLFQTNVENKRMNNLEEMIHHSDETRPTSMSTAVDIPVSKVVQTNASNIGGESNVSSFESGIDGQDFSSTDDDQNLVQPVETMKTDRRNRENNSQHDQSENRSNSSKNDLIDPEDGRKSNDSTATDKTCSSSANKNERESDRPTGANGLTQLASTLILPPKPASLTGSKIPSDLTRFNMNLFSRDGISKIQSVSFTPGTFGSITTDDSRSSSSHNQHRLNLNLRSKTNNLSSTIRRELPSSVLSSRTIDQSSKQSQSKTDLSTFLSSIESSPSKLSDGFLNHRDLFHENDVESSCRCQLTNHQDPSSDAEALLDCFDCMSNSIGAAALNYVLHPREFEAKERLKSKLNKRNSKDNIDKNVPNSTSNIRAKVKPLDNNIDDLVRFIDGDQQKVEIDGKTNKSKKTKKKKSKAISENVDEQTKPVESTEKKSDDRAKDLSENEFSREKERDKSSNDDKPVDNRPNTRTTTRSSTPSERTNSFQSNFDSAPESLTQSEEEINWITIARKTNKSRSSNATKTQSKTNKNSTSKKICPTQNLPVPPQVKSVKSTPNCTTKPIKTQPANVSSTKNSEKSRTTSCWTKQAPVEAKSLCLTVPQKNDEKAKVTEGKIDSSIFWNPNSTSFPLNLSTLANPMNRNGNETCVQRTTFPSNPIEPPISRCVQRPSNLSSTVASEPFNDQLDLQSIHWNGLISSSNQSNEDFPLYDPFKSGASLPFQSSSFLPTVFQDNRTQSEREEMFASFLPLDQLQRMNFSLDDLNKWNEISSLEDGRFFSRN